MGPEDLVKLYDGTNVALNPNTPTGLLGKTWFDVMMCLCRRGRENLRKMTHNLTKSSGPIVQFVDDARALINCGNFHRFNILNQYL
jgi:hypothetical protein